jgi:RecA/RadA recombinase
VVSDSQRYDVYKWLHVTDPSPIHHRAYGQYEVGTCDWILRSPDWIKWIDGKNRCLWIYGIPGSGKTILASHIIVNLKRRCEYVKTTQYACVYYYCYFGHAQDEASPFLRSIINQLSRQLNNIPASLHQLYRDGGHPSLAQLLHVLDEIVSVFDGKIYVVIDAIDESLSREYVIQVLRDLATDVRFQKVQLLITSRQYIDIETVMEQVSIPLSMLNPLVQEDIRMYVRSQLTKGPKFNHWTLKIKDEAVEVITDGAKGM